MATPLPRIVRPLALLVAALLAATLLPPPAAAATGWWHDQIGTAPLDVRFPSGGSGYRILSGCAGGTDHAPCVRVDPGGYVDYGFWLQGSGGGVDDITIAARGHASGGCDLELIGPTHTYTDYCFGSSPNSVTESDWLFRDGAAQGWYVLRLHCNASCNYLWLAHLEARFQLWTLHGGVYEVDQDHFPDDGDLPSGQVPELDACVVLRAGGSNWHPDISWRLDWGDGSSETGNARLERPWYQAQGVWARMFCHSYEFPMNEYQPCMSFQDSKGRSYSHCTTISGGLDAVDLVNDGASYATGSVTRWAGL